MRRAFLVFSGLLIAVPFAWAQTEFTSEDWTVRADPSNGVFSIEFKNLGTVLSDGRLNLRRERDSNSALRPVAKWTMEKVSENQFSIRTLEPPTRWLFELNPTTLKISSTTTDGVLTGTAPAPPNRIVARLLDRSGTPVIWRGTEEVNEGYGGKLTENPSFLPRQNPDVMYFALGQVTGSNLHSLFDRSTDTAIDFPEGTTMTRAPQDPNRLEVTIPLSGRADIHLLPDYYVKTLGVPYYVPFDDSHFPTAPAVWCSWDSYAETTREEDIVQNVDWISAHLKPYGFQYVVLDDGYDRGTKGEHYWTSNWDPKRFPHGPKWLASYVKSKGLHPGIWLVPNGYAGAVEQHPDWYLRDRSGIVMLDYSTPALDSSNPEVLEFLKHEFETLNDWGFEYYKFDGEHAIPKYVPMVDTNILYNKLADPLVIYRNRLKLIRDTVGPGKFIEGCPAGTPLNGIGYFNSYFNGHDMYSSWQGSYPMLSSINANSFLNHIVVYNMAGEGVELLPQMTFAEATAKLPAIFVKAAIAAISAREDPVMGIGSTLPEARTLVTYLSLTGAVYSLSSVGPELPEDREKLVKMTLPTAPILPIDLFSRGTDMRWNLFRHTTADDYIHEYPEILDLKVNAASGLYDVVGLTNWRGTATTREVAFAENLGLDSGSQYVIFDFWGQNLTGPVKGRIKTEIEPHDTRVLLVHPVQGRPQLVGNSRHITGAVSIRRLAWDESQNRLHGTSDTVPGDDYILWFYVPEGFTVAQVRATSSQSTTIAAHHVVAGNSLKVSLPGQVAPVDWQVDFRRKPAK